MIILIMVKKIEIGKGKKKRKVPESYVPKELSKADKKKQIKSIVEKKERPKVDIKNKKSGWITKFEKKYGKKITDKKWINDNLLKNKGQELAIKKGMAAYYSSGSRPNQNAFSWSRARLASVLMNGPARKVDKDIWEKYKVN